MLVQYLQALGEVGMGSSITEGVQLLRADAENDAGGGTLWVLARHADWNLADLCWALTGSVAVVDHN